MTPLTLTHSTTIPLIDRLLQRIIGAYEQTFPNRVRGYYLIRSYVERTAVPLSDLDCFVLPLPAYTGLFRILFLTLPEGVANWTHLQKCEWYSKQRGLVVSGARGRNFR